MPVMNKRIKRPFIDITTIGEKGQIVIPAEVRAAMKLTKGEKIIVFSPHQNAIVLMKASRFENFATGIAKRIALAKKFIKKI